MIMKGDIGVHICGWVNSDIGTESYVMFIKNGRKGSDNKLKNI